MTGRYAIRTTAEAPRQGASRVIMIVAWGVSAIALVLVLLNQTGTVDLNGTTGNLAAALQVIAGAVLVTRLPHHRVGWLLWAGGVLVAMSLGLGGIATAGLSTSPGSIPGAIWLAWLAAVSGLAGFAIAAGFLPLVYPTGRLPSPRWRGVAIAGGIVTVLATLAAAFGPFPVGTYPPGVQNPVLVAGPAGDTLIAVGGLAGGVGIGGFALAAALSIVLRYRRSAGVEREQIKWFAFVATIVISALLVAAPSGWWVAWLIALGGLALLPVAIGVAVLRYRLYDIDLVIRRTLVYGVLATLLAAAYAGSVLLLSAVLAPITSGSALTVAGSTLVVAGLFNPGRNRVRSVIDRRFYRSRYESARVLADLSGRLRNEVDLDGIRAETLATARVSLRPATASMWLRGESSPRGPGTPAG
jgi:hypothetical protein